MDFDELVKKLTDELVKRGKLVEAGFAGMSILMRQRGASDSQIAAMRIAYLSGAQHLGSSIMNILDRGDDEPTARDMERMGKIGMELEAVHGELENYFKEGRTQ